MSEKPPPVPAAPAKPAPAAVIRRTEALTESTHDRLVKKYLPAWVISGALHVAVIVGAWTLLPKTSAAPEPEKPQPKIDSVVSSDPAPPPKDPVDLTNQDVGLKADIEAAAPVDRIDTQTAEAPVTEDKTVGSPLLDREDNNAALPPGLAVTDTSLAPGFTGDTGMNMSGTGGLGGSMVAGFVGRSGATKDKLVQAGGGSKASEVAVANGLAWLAKQQKMVPNTNPPVGYWEYDGESRGEHVAATGMALLPFLAAGETHRQGRYAKNIDAGLRYLIGMLDATGKFKNGNMYAHGIGTMALCEAYGMTKDRALLQRPAQAAVNFCQQAQGQNGSWGYSAGANGDTSIVGWQVQALRAAQLTKDLKVNEAVVKKAMAFLDSVGSGERSLKSRYGYSGPNGADGTSLTAVGLLCRYYMDGWTPDNAAFAAGTLGLMRHGPRIHSDAAKAAGVPDMYYYYYATQVVHFYEGPEWKRWNEGPRVRLFGARLRLGGMRDWLIDLQHPRGADKGSWEPDKSHIGRSCGRLGTTCLALLTLEVYYRNLPLYKRKAADMDAGLDALK